jgi:lipopolysaccharide cholinephosphotransferase
MKSIAIIFVRLIGVRNLIKLAFKLARIVPYDRAKYVGILSFSYYGIREKMTKKEFQDTTQVEFEGHLFTAVKDWDKYLTSIYGDYMKLPPEEKRTTHSFDAYIF